MVLGEAKLIVDKRGKERVAGHGSCYASVPPGACVRASQLSRQAQPGLGRSCPDKGNE